MSGEREVKKHGSRGGRESFYRILATSENEVKCEGGRRRALYEVVVDGGGGGGGTAVLGLNFIEN